MHLRFDDCIIINNMLYELGYQIFIACSTVTNKDFQYGKTNKFVSFLKPVVWSYSLIKYRLSNAPSYKLNIMHY